MNSAAEVERSSPVKRSKTAKKKHVAVASAMAADGEPSSEYVVKAGDTLMKVSWNVYRDIHLWRRIYEQNESVISNPMQLTAGTRLKVDAPQGEYVGKGEPFLIKTGDTLGSISGEVYGVREKWRKIWDNNRELIHDPNRIYAGFMLYYLPESTVPPDSQRITQAPAKTQQEEAPQLSPTSPSSIVEEVPARQPSSTTPPSTP
jgi:nucleoid-associated protein YgaU